MVKLAHCAGDPVQAAAVGSTSGRDRVTGCFSFLRFPVETVGRAVCFFFFYRFSRLNTCAGSPVWPFVCTARTEDG